MKFHFSIEEGKKELEKINSPFVLMLQHGTMKVEYYAPKLIDKQTPHTKDEIYVIASGNAVFYRAGETVNCNKGDILFVPALMEHRFANFSEDFATWVIFYGEDGGKKAL